MTIPSEDLVRLEPRLRVICNGDADVNALRSELSAAVEAPSELVRDYGARQILQRAAREPREAGPLEDPPSQTELEEEVTVSCFLRLEGSVTEPAGLPPRVVRQGGLRYAFGDVTSVAADVAGER